jgi:hypothetical protein
MKSNSENATALRSVTAFGTVADATADPGIRTGVDNSTYGRLYRFSNHQAATSDAVKMQMRLRETVMLNKIRRLSPPRSAELNSVLDGMLATDEAIEAERETQALQDFGRSQRVLAKVWDNPEDAEYNNL